MVDFSSCLVVFIGYIIMGEAGARLGLAPLECIGGLVYLHQHFLSWKI